MAARPYEALFIANPQLDEEALESLVTRVQSVVTDGGGELEKVDKWGKRRLAYEVAGFSEGIYVLLDFKAERQVAQELERVFRITDGVIRHLLIRRDARIPISTKTSAAPQGESAPPAAEKVAAPEAPAAPAAPTSAPVEAAPEGVQEKAAPAGPGTAAPAAEPESVQ